MRGAGREDRRGGEEGEGEGEIERRGEEEEEEQQQQQEEEEEEEEQKQQQQQEKQQRQRQRQQQQQQQETALYQSKPRTAKARGKNRLLRTHAAAAGGRLTAPCRRPPALRPAARPNTR